MNVEEFNNKWKSHLVEGFDGLEFDTADNKISYLIDRYFQIFSYINPLFTYSQIKLKFGMARVYLGGLPRICSQFVEEDIDKIIKQNINDCWS